MATYTEVLANDFNYPNIDIYRRYTDGVQTGYKVLPQEGYVMYSPTNDVITELDPNTGEEVTNIYYCRLAILPLRYNFDNFNYIAVLESDVPADHIFGGGDNNDHEVM